VACEDLQAAAASVLRHRLILNFEGQAEGIQPDAVVQNIVQTLREPAVAA
jgi:MoxR-like ATPase